MMKPVSRRALRTMRSLATPVCSAVALAVGGCDGSELVRPLGATAEPEAPAAALDFAFQLAEATVGLGVDTVTLDRADESPAYFGEAGFQVDVGALAIGQEAGGLFRLSLDGEVLAEIPGAGSVLVGGLFRSVTLPFREVPLQVQVAWFETEVDTDGNVVTDAEATLVAEKTVTLTGEPAACEVAISVDANAAGCAPLTVDPTSGEPGDLGVAWSVTRLAGACDAISGTVSGDDGAVLGELSGTFDETGVARGFLVLGAAIEAGTGEPTRHERSLTFAVTATDSEPVDGTDAPGQAELTARADNTPPDAAFVTPLAEGAAVVRLEDDADPATDGLQLVPSGQTTAVDAVAATLARDGAAGEAVVLAGPGAFVFPAETFTGDADVTLAIAVTDACGNVGRAEQPTRVLATPGAIAIANPRVDTLLLARDDVDPATRFSYETEVVVGISGATPGLIINVTCDGLVSGLVVGSLTVDEVSDDGTYAVPVSIPVDTLGTDVTCTASTSLGTASEPVAIVVALPAPTLGVVAPADTGTGPQCIATSTIPVSLLASDLEGRDVTLAFGSGDAAVIGQVADGAFSGEVEVPAGTPDGLLALAFDAEDALGNRVSESQGDPTVTVRLDRAAPRVLFTSPTAASLRVDQVPDANPEAPGYQVVLGGSYVDAAFAAGLSLGGWVCVLPTSASGEPVPAGPCAAVQPDGRWQLELRLTRGDNLVTLQAVDDCGNVSAEAGRILRLDSDYDLQVTTPADGAVLLAGDDGDSATADVFEGLVGVTAPFVSVGDVLTAWCRTDAEGAVEVAVGALSVSGPLDAARAFEIPVTVPVGAIGSETRCRVIQTGGDDLMSADIAVVFAIPAPTLAFTGPTEAACFNTSAVAFAGTANRLDGQSMSLVVGDLQTEATVAAGAFGGVLDAATLPDGGPWTLVASGTDRFGNPVAAVTTFTLDRVAPVLTRVAPDLAVDPFVDPDTSEAPGFQADVVLAVADASLAGAEVCLTLGAGEPRCAPVTESQVTFAAVTLQPRTNSFTASVVDGCGTAGAALDFDVEVAMEALTATVVTPAAATVTANAAIALTARATDPESGVPLAGGTARLWHGETQIETPFTDNGDGTYTFPAVPLAAGETVALSVEIDVGFLTGVSAPRTIRQKNVAPTAAVTSPTAGWLNLTSACTNAGTGCVTAVTVATTDVEDGSEVRLALTCPGVSTNLSRTITANVATFPGIAFPEGAACTLVASVTDAAGQVATSPAVSVTSDRQSPAVTLVDIPSLLQTNEDTNGTLNGIQRALQVDTVDAGAGTTVAVRLDWVEPDGARTRTVSATAAAGQTSYNLEDLAGSGAITWPDGIVTLTATIADRAGNPATTTTTVTVSSATIAIASPASVESACSDTCTVGFCNAGECWRGWGISASRNLSVNLSNVSTTTANLRVCSDHPSLAGTGAAPCITPNSTTGAYRVVHAQDAVSGSNIVPLGAVLPDGYQRLVVEARPLSTGGWITSANAVLSTQRQRRVLVDLTAPTVSAVTSPSDTLLPTGALNAAEAVASPRTFTVRYTTDEPGDVSYFVNDATTAVRTESAPAAGSFAADIALPEGTPDVWVVVTDRVGNASLASPGVGATTYRPLVDVTAPTLAFTRPSSSPLNAAANRDVALTSDAEGQAVTVFDDGVQVATAPVAGGSVSLPHATAGLLSDGSHRLTATVADAAGNGRTVATTPALVAVDTQPPGLSVSTPADSAALTDANDASADFGYQLDVTWATSAGAETWEVLTQTNCDASFEGCDGEAPVASGAVTNPGNAEPTLRINVPLTAATTRFRVIIRVTDAVGNVTTVSQRVTVSSTACQVVFTNLPSGSWFNASYCPGGVACASAVFALRAATVGVCLADTIELWFDGARVGTSPLASFDGDFDVTVPDGDAAAFELRLTAGGVTVQSTTASRTVDFTPPVPTFVARNVDGFTTAASGASLVYGSGNDLEPGTPGAQLHASLDVADTFAAGGAIVSLVATAGATSDTLSPSNVTLPLTLAGASPVSTDLRSLTLGDGQTWTVTATVRDAAGNQATTAFTARADVTAPSDVTITGASWDPRGTVFDPLSWTAVGDNGGAGGAVAAYAVRYSAQPITEANWDAACDFQDVYGSEAMPAPALPGEPMEAALGGPDSRAYSDACKLRVRFQTTENPADPALYVAVRAVDAAGNLSGLGAGSVATLTKGQLWVGVTRIRLDNSTNGFGTMTATALAATTVSGATLGDINGDGRTDIGLGISAANLGCVLVGHAVADDDPNVANDGEVLTSLSGTNHTCITPTMAAAVVSGIDSVGNQAVALGDVNGDGRRDFGLTARRTWTAPWAGVKTQREGLLFIYLGRAAAGTPPSLTTPDVIIRGLTTQTTTVGYVSSCGSGDLNGDGIEDIGLGEPSLNQLHIIPGRATWTAVAGGGSPTVVDLAPTTGVADAGGMTLRFNLGTGGTVLYGGRCGRAGDVLPTPTGLGPAGLGDVIIAATGADNGRLFVHPGRAWTAGEVRTVNRAVFAGDPSASDEDRVSLRLRQEADGIQANSIIGVDFQGGVDATGDGVPDVLAVTSNRRPPALDGKAIYLFDGARLGPLVGTDVTVNIGANPRVGNGWTGLNGWVIFADPPAGRFAATRLLRFTETAFMTPAAFEPPHLWTEDFNSTGATFAANHLDAAESVTLGQFPVQDGALTSLYRASSISIGGWHGGGADFTGDGRPDLIEGTNFNELIIVR